MPFITLTGGLTLKVPTRGTEDWDTEFLNNFAQKISEHDHTGSGKGLQLGSGAIALDALDDRHTIIRHLSGIRSYNSTNSATFDMIKMLSDTLSEVFPFTSSEFRAQDILNSREASFTNNQAVFAASGIELDSSAETSAKLFYEIERKGTADLREEGSIEFYFDGSAWNFSREFLGDEAGLDFQVNGTDLEYTSTDNAGSTSEKIKYIFIKNRI